VIDVNRRRILTGLAAVACVPRSVLAQSPPAATLLFAAASVKPAIDRLIAPHHFETGHRMVVNYGGSPALARQIEQGAPADLILTADEIWMSYLAGKGLIRPQRSQVLLRNRLVLIASASDRRDMALGKGFDLVGALGGGRLATAQTTTVPAGIYARAALTHLDIWNAVSTKLAETENVRAALVLVARGEAPLGIVYATDAQSEPHVRVVATFPEASHPPIRYPLAMTSSARPHAEASFTFLTGAIARAIFDQEGFLAP
jgi:molybdate transport system substrate-binding protein